MEVMENVWGRPLTALWGEDWCDALPGCSASGDGVNQPLWGVWALSELSSWCRQVGLASYEISPMQWLCFTWIHPKMIPRCGEGSREMNPWGLEELVAPRGAGTGGTSCACVPVAAWFGAAGDLIAALSLSRLDPHRKQGHVAVIALGKQTNLRRDTEQLLGYRGRWKWPASSHSQGCRGRGGNENKIWARGWKSGESWAWLLGW